MPICRCALKHFIICFDEHGVHVQLAAFGFQDVPRQKKKKNPIGSRTKCTFLSIALHPPGHTKEKSQFGATIDYT